jgi:hypothetical protein
MFELRDIGGALCVDGTAGINAFKGFNCDDVTLTFDTDGVVSAITIPNGSEMTNIKPYKDTANLEQAKTKNRNAVNVAQTANFELAGLSTDDSNGLEALNKKCCIAGFAQLNSGDVVAMGVSYNKAKASYMWNDMQTGEGSNNTGTDPAADNAVVTETLVANTRWYAPKVDVAWADIAPAV